MTSERWLKVLLRFGGLLTGSAIFAVFLPTETMAAIHRSLGMEELPAAPITEYLTRSLSAMYALHGVVLWALSMNVRRHLTVIVWNGWATAVLGVLFFGVGAYAGMPPWWRLTEGPWVTTAGLLCVILARRVRAETAERRVEGITLKEAAG